ncbi:wax ester/triacylglycerol synthase domain-containing protein [Mycolicibacterium stellerae]|uniref:wax ester/triacylglycerol synthase domain-containing protein n=1 Tax=Mycolicibacterium stellerae TaxID=2358193 RepID=UPI000F0B2C6E|nr:wax ester/triacylglycerol synthase domain-containing protein [Mycolicibacterium stellerae]
MADFLRNSDAFVWSIEGDPRLRSTIVTLVVLEQAPDWDEVVTRFELLTDAVPKFRQRVVESPYPLPPRWEDDPDFDLTFHLRRITAPKPGSLDTALEIARVAAMADFDRARPLWEATVIDGLSDGGAALLCKLHHALTDGVGAVEMSAILFDREQRSSRRGAARTPTEPATSGLPALVRDIALDGGRLVVRALNEMPKLVLDSVRSPIDTVADAVSTIGSIARTMRPILYPGSPIMTDRGTVRRLAVSQVSMDKLHRAGKVAGGSLNDALIAAIAGGLCRYHEKHGKAVNHFVVSMPISTRTAEDPIGGNRATLMRFDVPAADMDPALRIRLIHEQSAKARQEKSLAYTQQIAGVLNIMPAGYVGSALRHVDFVASNVPGFPERLYFAGAAVRMPFAFSPTIGAAMNITLLSYVDTCSLGINVDTGAISDLGDFYDCLAAGFDDVLNLVADN